MGQIELVVVATFLTSVAALMVFIWAQSKNLLGFGQRSAEVIFAPGELGTPEDIGRQPDNDAHGQPMRDELAERMAADRAARSPVMWWLGSATYWLVVGSVLGLIASLKMHWPDWLTQWPELTFGRVRPAHLNIVAYGWASMAGVGVALWMIPRLLKTPLRGHAYATAGAIVWNLGMTAGFAALLGGWTDGLEWLEFPWQIDGLFVVGGALAAVPLLLTLKHRQVDHLFVTVWYMGAALLWFPLLFLVANLPLHFGVQEAVMNWWYAHNVLGLWLTPFGLGAAYYLISKILGRPVYSYNLSLIGFWALALFYNHAGVHHLIGGPVPTWLVAIGIVHSMMMFVPVLAVFVNHFMTMQGSWKRVWASPTLRFVALGAMTYTVVSMQGSLEALRSINRVVHFTHYTVAHAHLGVYGFFSLIMFGAIYFLVPRIMGREWMYPRLIALHFWLAVIGFAIYFAFLTWGGVLQGLAMLDAARPFMDSVTLTLPYLQWRSLGGTLMTLGHFVFAYHLAAMFFRIGPVRHGAATLAAARA
jgi:cytochrome c oxidase cbb3-type subunit 1